MLKFQSKNYHQKSAYTLGELIFVIFLFFALISISVFLRRQALDEAHRLTCLSDVIQIQSALETYFKLEKSYPDTWLADLPLIALSSGKVIMPKMPINQAWSGEKTCSDSTVTYSYAPLNGGYVIRYCVNGKTEQHTKKRSGIILPKAKDSDPALAPAICPSTQCSGDTMYYNKTNQACTSTIPDLTNDPVALSQPCDACSDYGDLCSGGYLFCKPTDLACSGKFAVAAPVDLSGLLTWDGANTACQKYQSAGLADWSLPNFSTTTPAADSSQICQLMRSSEHCQEQTVVDKCGGGCLLTDQQKLIKLPALKYWSALERSADTAWLQYSEQARTGYDDKSNSHSVRCVRSL